MALIDKLNAIGDAIREKTGKTEKLTLDEMPNEIVSIVSGGGDPAPANPVIESLEVTENGTYTAPSGVDGYSPVTVNVPIPEGYIKPSGSMNINENGKYTVTTYDEVDVNVPIPEGYIIPSGTKEITENGEHIVTEYEKVNVNVPSGGGGNDLYKQLIERSLTEISDSSITTIGGQAFRNWSSLKKASFPNATSIGTYAFYECDGLTEAIYPNCTSIGTYAFYGSEYITTVDFPKLTTVSNHCFRGCSRIVSVNFPIVTTLNQNAFQGLSSITKMDFPMVKSISTNVFYLCSKLTTLILRSTTMATLSNKNSFASTPIDGGTGYIYVPSALIDSYKGATNWSTYADQFRAIEDYPDICGG